MFEAQSSTSSNRSSVLKIGGVIALGLIAVVVFYKSYGYRWLDNDSAHYDELERHRAAQQQQPDVLTAPAAPVVAQQPAPVVNAEQSAPGAPATTTSAPAQAATAVESTGGGKPANAGASASGAAQTAVLEANHPTVKPAAAGRNYWTNFRGPNRDGHYDESAVKTSWPSAGLKQAWKQPIGVGFASFVVADGVAYTIEQRRKQEVVTAYNVETGRELWTHGWDALFTDSTGDGPRATPTWDAGRIYAQGAAGELRCLDAKTGKLFWRRNILSDSGADNLSWGMAGSPLVVDDKVIVLAGGGGGRSVAAYHKLTGAPVWKSQNDRASYTSPMLVNLGGRRQVLLVSANRMFSLAPEDGSLLWSHPWETSMGINVSQPIIIDKNHVFISAGYGKGASLVELQPTSGGKFTARSLWENINLKTKFNSPVYHNGHVYGLDEGILACVDAQTGERKWKGGRYGYGQLLVASGHLIILTDTGELALVKAEPSQFTEVAKFPAIQGKTWNVPAIAGGRLLVRNGNEMACYSLTE
ncbi:MAG: PQQ-binding-like beta-propeller repeat protein [Acidobacteriota bacterium]|nr:PQQ-binding-like beta-propeller repeat protein [Acidobacteriota bacterium]